MFAHPDGWTDALLTQRTTHWVNNDWVSSSTLSFSGGVRPVSGSLEERVSFAVTKSDPISRGGGRKGTTDGPTHFSSSLWARLFFHGELLNS